MTPIERQILKNQASIMNALVDITEVNTESISSFRDRVKETFLALNPKGSEDPCCKMDASRGRGE